MFHFLGGWARAALRHDHPDYGILLTSSAAG
jgi:hypothetical protein